MTKETHPRKRGRNTPLYPLGECVQFVKTLYEGIGKGPFSRASVADAWEQKFKSGAFDRKIGALMHFGLLERTGTQYRVSQEALCIVSPTSAEEAGEATVLCAKKPVIFSELFEKFEGQALPVRLANVLSREHGVLHGSSEDSAKVFLESMAFAKLTCHGILHTDPQEVPASVDDNAQPGASEGLSTGIGAGNGQLAASAATSISPPTQARGSAQNYTIPLKGTGECAMISLPVPLEQRDLKQVKAWLDYMLEIANEQKPDISQS